MKSLTVAFGKPTYLLLGVLALVWTAAIAQKVEKCTKDELDTLLLNQNIRNCAASYTDLLPNKGCESGLGDQACYCHSPDFMAAVTGCLFKEQPDVQEELLRCAKWYSCDTLEASLRSSNASLTPESNELLAKGRNSTSSAADGATPQFAKMTIRWTALASISAAFVFAVMLVV